MKYILKDKVDIYTLEPSDDYKASCKNVEIVLNLTDNELKDLRKALEPYKTEGGYYKRQEVLHIVDMYKLKDIVFKIKSDVDMDRELLHKHLMAAGGTVNSNTSIDDLDIDLLNDRNEPSIDEEPDSTELQTITKNIATLKPLTFKYVQWKDNLSEMKRFCLDDCKIEYMTCHIDDYWMLTVNDCIKNKWVSVTLNDYVVKLDEGFTVINNRMFKKYFDKE